MNIFKNFGKVGIHQVSSTQRGKLSFDRGFTFGGAPIFPYARVGGKSWQLDPYGIRRRPLFWKGEISRKIEKHN